MKTKIFRTGKRTLSVFLAILMIVSTMLVGMVHTSAASSGTVTVYFKNTLNWSDVYVYFYKDIYWDNNTGSGSSKSGNCVSDPIKMSIVDSTNKIYKATYTGTYCNVISFTKDSQSNYGSFWETSAVYRADFSTSKPLYTPNTTSNESKNNTAYYNNGTWSAYSEVPPITKWYIVGSQSNNTDDISWKVSETACVVNGATGSYTLAVDGNTNKIYFKLVAVQNNDQFLCTAAGTTTSVSLSNGVKSAALDWSEKDSSNSDYGTWDNFTTATNSSGKDVELVFQPSSSDVESVTFDISSSNGNNYVTVTENLSTKRTIYLKPGLWDKDGAWFAAYVYGGSSGSKYYTFTEVEDGIYSAEIDTAAYPKVQFLRMSSSATTPSTSGDNLWNSVSNQSFQADKNCFTITDWGSGKWETYTPSGGGEGGGDDDDDTVIYKLYDRNQSNKLIGSFKASGATDTYTLTVDLDAGKTYKLYVDDIRENATGWHYIADNETLTLNGSSKTLSRWNNSFSDKGITFSPTASATYVFTWVCDAEGNHSFNQDGVNYNLKGAGSGKLSVKLDAKPLADSVTVTAKFDGNGTTVGMTDETVTVTATIVNPADGVIVDSSDSSCNVTYTLYKNGTSTGKSNKTGVFTGITSSSSGNVSYSVVVSTTATYTNDSQNQQTYADITSTSAVVTYNTKGLYYADITGGTSNVTQSDWKQISDSATTYTISPTVASGGTYIFVLSDSQAFNPDYNVSYSIDSSKCAYCTVTKGNILEGVTTYIVKCNAGCSNPVITIDKENRTIYAVADFTPTMTKTEDSKETVTYYFAEKVGAEGHCLNGDGVRIRYWNNSTGKSGKVDVTTKATLNSSSTSNIIYVNTAELYGIVNNSGKTQFKVYKAELPVWATSFSFLFTNDGAWDLQTNSSTAKSYTSISLNPNRIYLFYIDNSDKWYGKGIILDEQLWSSSNNTNYTGTKNFKTNLVNYNDDSTDTFKKLNSALSSKYSADGIKNPLYFGYFANADSGKNYHGFDLANNLAQRCDEGSGDKAFYASIWGLTGSKLYYPTRSIATYGKLTDANNKNHPLFDYEYLETNSNIASLVKTGLNFPFYESDYRGITTYSYDSTTDYNRKYSDSTKDFYITDAYSLGSDADGTQYTGYFPFGGNSDKVSNTGFGTEFDIDFYMTDSGKLVDDDNKEQDICFNFSGDDDVWVYIDGVLVLDLGGDHKISAGSINFSDMMVYYKSAAKDTDSINAHNVTDTFATSSNYVKAVNMAELFAANGVTFENTDPSTMHTLQMFYMERGTFQSNCSISFNLPQNSGLRINSDVDTSKVNNAFVNDTLLSANTHFFSYTLENKAASDTEYTNVKNAYSTAASKASALSAGGLTLGTPEFPILSNVNRDFNGIIYSLSLSTNTEAKKTSDDYIGSNGSSPSFIPVKGVNYKLNDAYSKAASDDDALKGVSGRTDSTGTFELLFDQSAQFDTKITPNTLVSVTQNNQIYDVVSQTGSVVSNTSTSNKNVSDFYSSKYTITDDRSGKIIYSNDSLTKNGNGGINADDNSSNADSFYFSNYTGDATDSSFAMTVTFINSVDVGTIKIEKSLASGLTANADKFFFDVEFSNVFGGSSAKQKYEDLTYTVYNSDGTKVSTNSYGSTGVILMAGQYALIEGVPVGTKYTVSERTRVGYALDSVSAKSESTLGAVINSNTVTVGSDNVVTGNIPFATDYNPANYVYSSISTSSFVNIRQAITITFKYYDREVVSGTVSHINEEVTTYNHTFAELPSDYCELNSNGEVTEVDLAGLIAYAAVEFSAKTNVTNVIDEYEMWTSQAAAVEAMKKTPYLKADNGDGGTLYNADQAVYHTNAYGVPQMDGEKWVNYYSATGESLNAESFTSGDAKSYSQIKSITVWLFNQPRKYNLTMNYAEDSSHLGSANADGNYVANGNRSNIFTGYYNQRLGSNQGVSSQDSAGEYLNKYGITDGFVGGSVTTNPIINKDNKDLKFLYWSDKADGSTIVSTDSAYLFRITGNRTLYAVYGDTMTDKPGLTVSENQKDIYFDSNGTSKTRLNTQMNVYNCPDSDKNISQTAIVYLMIHENISIDEDLETIRTEIADILKNTTSTSVSGTIFEIDKKANGYIYNVKDSAADVTTSSDVTLTNKNRMQFTITFTSSALNSGKVRMCAFAAMNYSGEWIVSDNYVDYNFLSTTNS